MVVAGIILFLYVAINAILLSNGTFQPIKVNMANSGYGNDAFAGILLQIGAFSILVGIAFAVTKAGISFVGEG